MSPLAGVEILWCDQSLQQHFAQPGQALCPDQGEIAVGLARLAAWLSPFRFDPISGHLIQLGVERFPIPMHGQGCQLVLPGAGVLPAFLAAGGDQFKGQKQRPLRFNPFELGELLRLVMKTIDVFHGGLMAITKKAFVAIGAAQFPPYPAQGPLHQVLVFDGPGREAHHRQASAVGFLAGGFPRQQAFEGPPQTNHSSLGDEQLARPITVDPEEVEAFQGLQSGFRHADGAGIAFGQAVVAFVAPFPDAVIRGSIRPGDVVHEVLNEIHLIPALDHGAATAGELSQLEQKQGSGIELQMSPGVIRHHRIAAAAVVLRVQSVERIEADFEALHLPGLAEHGSQQPPHQGDHPLLELPGPPVVGSMASTVGHGQSPDALHGVDTVPHPGIAVVAVNRVGGAGGQQTTDWVLTLQHHLLNRTIEPSQDCIAMILILLGLCCRHHHDPSCRRF